MRGARLGVVALGLLAVPLLSSCTGGMLDPQSPRADKVIVLWWVMLGTSSVIFVFLCGLLLWGLRRASRRSARAREGQLDRDRYLVLGGGIALPVTEMVVLMVLTVWAGRSITEAAGSDAVTVEVIGHQWWWEVRYPDTGLVTANEIHIPSGEPVNILLKSEDVIHSFWVPELSGKIDLIPGRTNSLIIEASHPGEFRGQCAEFCGLQHAGMRILVVAEDRDSFDQWVQEQGEPAPALNPADDAQLWEGQQAFLGSACVYCHTIRGTNGSGTLGPDLTHIASRQRLASNMIPNTRGHLAGWILDPQAVKPGTQMPPTQLSADQLDALLDYLESLK